MIKFASALLVSGALLAACGDSTLPAAPGGKTDGPAREINHWPSYGTPGFWFPYVDPPAGQTIQPFDATLSPTVEVCKITSGSCGPIVATFTKTSGTYGRLVTVNTQASDYEVDWPTGSTGVVAGNVYRVMVRVGTRALGYGDVKFVSNTSQYGTVDTNQYYPWVAGTEIQITFTIRQGIPSAIQVPSSVALNVGEGKSFTGTVLDLHGAVIAGAEPGMLIQNVSAVSGNVAVLDSGVVVGKVAGTATLYAWWNDLMVSVPVTVTDTRRAWTPMTTPDAEAVRAVWGSSSTDVYAATNTGVMRWNGTAWSYQAPVRWRSLYDVTGFSASNVWAVGDGGIIARFDGTTWTSSMYDGNTVTPLPLTSFARPARKLRLRGVWGSSASNVVVVGDSGVVAVYNGSTWTNRASGVTTALTDVWGSSASDFYATTADGRIVRFNASTASVVAGVQAPGALLSVWGSSASNIYAVGEGGLVYKYNGSSWSRVRLPTRATLYTVWGSSASEVYVGGSDGALYRFDGTTWTPEKRSSTSAAATFQGIWGTGTNIYAVGGGGLVTKR